MTVATQHWFCRSLQWFCDGGGSGRVNGHDVPEISMDGLGFVILFSLILFIVLDRRPK